MEVDFLVVAALKDEATEIAKFLASPEPEGEYILGKIPRWKGRGEYTVAIVNLHDGMGAHHAGPVTQDAITKLKPWAVLLTGIAAGFEDARAKVALGDLMVPYGVVPYELAKLVGQDKEKDSPAAIEHRGVAWAVSESLWRTAANVANDTEQPWLAMVKAERPEGAATPPKIHSSADSVLGCGEKVVADEEAEERKWLIATYPRQILGLEMESYAAMRSCRMLDKPFLVAKASVDKATLASKGDLWRAYACQLSAGFLVTVIARYDRPGGDLLIRHVRECEELAAEIKEDDVPRPDFQYKIRTAASFSQLRHGTFYEGEKDRSALIPSARHQTVALYGGGGTGKSTVAQRLFCDVLKADDIPVLLDLKRFSQEYIDGGDGETIDSIIQIASSPRRTAAEIEKLASQGDLVLLIDGANEVAKTALALLVSFCRELRRGPGCRSVWMNRMTPIEDLMPEPLHATVTAIPPEVAEKCFDDRFGQGKFRALSSRLQTIYRRPFFLDLAIRSNRPFTANRLWSEIFLEFFEKHLALTEAQLDELAAATRAAIGSDGRIRIDRLKLAVDPALWQKLVAAEVGVVDDQHGFAHHLWRDYLVARSLRGHKEAWTEETFDAVTTFTTSVESLVMAVEQIANGADKVAFVAAVYDWSYTAALECIALSGGAEEAERRIPAPVREAILAVVAEKRFDPVQRTRDRAGRLLSQYPFAKLPLECPTRESLVEHARQTVASEPELMEWLRLFGQTAGPLPRTDLDLISSQNSLIGWTAANLARRSTLSADDVSRVCTIYRENLGPQGRRSVRWRAVHVLGAHPSEESVQLLTEALERDEYRWVAYGTARSLVEAASRLNNPRRQEVIDVIVRFVEGEGGGAARPMILQEIVETCFINGAARGWGNAALPLLLQVLGRATTDMKAILGQRLAAFREQYLAERRSPANGASAGPSSPVGLT